MCSFRFFLINLIYCTKYGAFIVLLSYFGYSYSYFRRVMHQNENQILLHLFKYGYNRFIYIHIGKNRLLFHFGIKLKIIKYSEINVSVTFRFSHLIQLKLFITVVSFSVFFPNANLIINFKIILNKINQIL